MPARKITPEDVAEFRKLLLRARAIVTGDIERLEAEALAPAEGAEVLDAAGDRAAQDFSLELLERDEEALRRIDEALERIEAGHYGTCTTCGGPIPKSRLRAVPHAATCVACQRQAEERA